MKMEICDTNAPRAIAILKVMSNAMRIKILTTLFRQEWPVGELAQRLRISQSALSQHLRLLRDHSLVNTRREGQTIYYTAESPVVACMLDVFETVADLAHQAHLAERNEDVWSLNATET